MPTYALLGATGSTGSAILRHLLAQPPQDLNLNVFVRSKSKLLGLFPGLEKTTSFKLAIIEATPKDSAALQRCLTGANAVFMCIANNIGKPGISLIVDTATAIISALKILRKEQGGQYTTPTILQLRSAQQNAVFLAHTPRLVNTMLGFANYYVYKDGDDAYALYEQAHAADPELLVYISVDPPALHDAKGKTPTGHELSMEKPLQMCLSYADLGAAFVEIAERRTEFAFKGVGVSATGHVNLTWSTNMSNMGRSVLARAFG